MSVPFALAVTQRELIQDPAVIEELDRWAAKLNGYLQSITVPDAEANLDSGIDNTNPSNLPVVERITLASDTDSLDIGSDTDVLVLTPSGSAVTLAGIRGGFDGRALEIIVPASASVTLTFAHNSGNAEADELLLLAGAADITTVAGEARGLILRYDGDENAWTQVGGSSAIAAAGGGLQATIEGHTQVATDAATSEKDLVTGTLAANVLSGDGDMLIVRAFGNFANNGNGKRLRFYWNGTAVADTGAQAWQDQGWQLHVILVRTGSAAQKGHGQFIPAVAGVSPQPGDFFSDTADLTATVSLKITGTNSTSSAGDITFEGWTVYRIAAP